MSPFDPYHKWLGISPKDQPPNHYRLLAIDPFEPDPEVIAAAADQRMAHVRSFQTGKHSGLSQRILNEIAAARVCLLNAAKKAEYDAKLRSEAESVPVATPVAASPPIPVAEALPASPRIPVAEAVPASPSVPVVQAVSPDGGPEVWVPSVAAPIVAPAARAFGGSRAARRSSGSQLLVGLGAAGAVTIVLAAVLATQWSYPEGETQTAASEHAFGWISQTPADDESADSELDPGGQPESTVEPEAGAEPDAEPRPDAQPMPESPPDSVPKMPPESDPDAPPAQPAGQTSPDRGPLDGTWRTPEGVRLRMIDNGSTVEVSLVSGSELRAFSGTFIRGTANLRRLEGAIEISFKGDRLKRVFSRQASLVLTEGAEDAPPFVTFRCEQFPFSPDGKRIVDRRLVVIWTRK